MITLWLSRSFGAQFWIAFSEDGPTGYDTYQELGAHLLWRVTW